MQGRKRLKVFLVVQGRETRPSPFFRFRCDFSMVRTIDYCIQQIRSHHYNETMFDNVGVVYYCLLWQVVSFGDMLVVNNGANNKTTTI